MTTYIDGFSKTIVNGKKKEIKWKGIYDEKKANLDININNKKDIHLQLTNNDLMKLLETKSVEKPLEERLYVDFLKNKTKTKRNKSKTNKSKTNKSNKRKSKT
jgi:hypothetical protein